MLDKNKPGHPLTSLYKLDTILTKKRNRLSDANANANVNVIYHARENLNYIMNAKRILGKSITDSIN